MKNRFTFLMAFCLMAMSSFSQVVDIASGFDNPVGVALGGNTLFVSEYYGNKVSSIDISQTNPIATTFVSGIFNPTGLLLNGNDLYVNSASSGSTYKIDLTQPTPTVEVFVSNIPGAEGLLLAGDDLYISYMWGAGGIKKVNINNPATVTDVISGCEVGGMVIKGNELYFAESLSGTRVKKFTLGVPNPTAVTVVSNLSGPNGLTLNGNFLYISEANGTRILRIDITETNPTPEAIVTGLSKPSLTVFDGIDMYFSQELVGKVSKLAIANPSFSNIGNICANAVPTDLGGASPTGGSYSGPGVTNNGNGETFAFNPAAAGGPGTYTVTYTAINGSTATSTLTVVAPPTVTINLPMDTFYMTQAMPQMGINGGGTPAGGVYSDPYAEINDDGNGMTFSFNGNVTVNLDNTIKYTYTAANGCTNTAQQNIWVSGQPSAVHDLSSLQVVVAPNPTSGMVEIQGIQPEAIKVVDSLGRLVLSQKGSQQVDLSHLPSGMYTLLVGLGNGEWGSAKVVKE
ncbi:MAG: T9SS type A sorting domain-containing protein [Saprospiraceae bacterium]|nr:T9SS type A sorting domain-containing protein [Saprospiraceae bacterium]MCF8249353.1 T9SS type A sorting domain-containing protein [Saprospiraceae bacterium]MCF8279005.1 T9SS type A sorting domain-containing protein [Bacteroidales bacterium]MCF8311482.1 T9SS type A sorting domain-containing protein [Saprospiraceae bacterium]MCF8439972.1 T9SS type A sorting domain-containing protein [Saprospiraceae bacterium]